MIVVQSVLCLVIPVLMWYLGKTFRNGAVPYKKEKGVRFRSKRALASEQSWTFSNDLFFNLLRMCGINLALISIVLLVPVFLKAPRLLWTLVITLLIVQLAGGFLLPWIFTEMTLRKNFDESGVLRGNESEDNPEQVVRDEEGADEYPDEIHDRNGTLESSETELPAVSVPVTSEEAEETAIVDEDS